MANELQIIGDKIYYKMECVAILNALNTISSIEAEFKRKLVYNFNERDRNEGK